MTNADKYLKEGIDIQEFVKEFIHYYHANIYTLDGSLSNFFKVKIKPTLAEDERVILRNIDNEWKAIYRDLDGELELHTKVCEAHESCGWTAFLGFSHLFQFIKERRRIFY